MRLKIIYLFRKILDLYINLKKRQNEKTYLSNHSNTNTFQL